MDEVGAAGLEGLGGLPPVGLKGPWGLKVHTVGGGWGVM